MHFILDDRIPRQVLPRWRALKRVLGAETQSHKKGSHADPGTFEDYKRALRAWQIEPSLVNAAELIFAIGNWRGCIDNADKWHWDEPFAMRPIHMATFVSSEIVGDLAAAQEFAERAMIANDLDATALNNLVYVLAMRGRLDEAEEIQDRTRSEENDAEKAVNMATRGMLSLRRGKVEEGQCLYRKSIAELQRLKFRTVALIPRMHLCLELLRAGGIDIETFRRERNEIKREVDASRDKLIAAIFDNVLGDTGSRFRTANQEIVRGLV